MSGPEKKILWIEEEANEKLIEFRVYLQIVGYQLDIVYSATEAEEKIKDLNTNYDLILLDIRIFPGDGEFWQNEHLNGNKKLGLLVLKICLSQSEKYKDRVLVFSNEYWEDVQEELLKSGLDHSKFLAKIHTLYPEDIVAFITKNHPDLKIEFS
jgi:CheY-like chemotaxis protein